MSSLKYFAIPTTDTHGDQEREWYFLLDFDCHYTDLNGKTQLLPRIEPTKEAFLSTMEMASQNGSSGLVYYGGHGERGLPGSGELVYLDKKILYKEIVKDASGPIQTYLLCKDAQRISSEEFFSRLPDSPPPECVLTIVFDVVVTAARVGELAGTVLPPPGRPTAVLHGALTWFMVSWISKHPEADAVNVAQRLKYICAYKQHPRISARHPFTGPFQLLLRAWASFNQ
ncbi:hypothetical protein M407DRAFT_4173 [Tulasnella calospora MUT 4182]|uniref:Uncharacterized protein n=1 Tax=Tulasnella calospora MUT 4182 TaxID=1051891 RepID=A0A0C3QVX2_9AGAM|nr:hypothetical protein M407DRAFT_4173 [Tulasnella calospora MUT 4182]